MRRVVEHLAPPGIVRNLSLTTAQAFQTETNLDNLVIINEEFKSSWLYGTANEKDKGATQEINQVKMRMTSFFSETWAPRIDETTGTRTLVSSKASQNNVTIGGTNQFLAQMDKNIERRLIVLTMPKHVNAGEGSDAADLMAIEAFANNDVGRMITYRHQQVHALFILVSLYVKAGVLPDVQTGDAYIELGLVLNELSANRFVDTRDGTRRHFVLQLARNIQVWFACWLALYSPFAYEYHATEPDAKARWSPEAVLLLVAPFWKVSREALIYAHTLLEPLYAPRYVEQMLVVLATDCLQLDAPVVEWPLYFEVNPTTKAITYDCNYVMLEGARTMDICGAIARQNKEFLLRDADIEREVITLSEQHISCSTTYVGLDPDANNNNKPRALGKVPNANATRQAMRFDRHPQKANKWVLRVSIAFLEQRLQVNMQDSAAVRALRKTRQPLEFSTVRNPLFIEEYGRVPLASSPIAASIARTMGNSLFEQAPSLAPYLEHDPVWTQPPPFMTAYTVPPLTFFTDGAVPRRGDDVDAMDIDEAPSRARPIRTIPLHATHQMLPLARTPAHVAMQRENYLRPLPTAKRLFSVFEATTGGGGTDDSGADGGVNASAMRSRRFNNALGVIADHDDIEASFAADLMRQLCHPGFRFAEQLFAGAGRAPPEIVPYAFGPVLNRIFRALAVKNGDIAEGKRTFEYPDDNIDTRIRETLQLEHDKQNGTHRAFASFSDILGTSTFGGLCFQAANTFPTS